jgi:hypothetical protein
MSSSEERVTGGDGYPAGSRILLFVWILGPFLLLSTCNSAGYRYGASDQAFYAPAMLEAIDPGLFPRDSDLIRSQAKLTFVDDIIGPAGRATGASLPVLFVVLQVLTLGLLAAAAIWIGSVFCGTRPAIVGLLAAITLRHAISKSGTNTLEGYFHPRQLSFAIGALAVAAFLRGKYVPMAILVGVAGALHPTTGLWFAIWLGVAAYVAEARLRGPLIACGAIAVAVAAWSLSAGPLAGRLIVMDEEWLATLASKDYLFPLHWPASAWMLNLGYVPIVALLYRHRRARGCLIPRETALVAGCLALVIVFAALLPFNAARLALAIQLQPARVFWMLDFLAVIYVVWAASEGAGDAGRLSPIRSRAVAAALVLLSATRGTYIMLVEFPERRVVQAGITDDDWGRAMAWARASEPGSGWLADPGHAARYGTSVRVAGHRDVFVEAIKDGAVGMYERGIALRTRDRLRELGTFSELTAERARSLARTHGLDYIVTEHALELPLAFRTGTIRIYRLTPEKTVRLAAPEGFARGGAHAPPSRSSSTGSSLRRAGSEVPAA